MKIYYDLKRYSKNKIIKMICTLIFNPCFHCTLLLRDSQFFYNIKLELFAKIVWYINRIIFNVDIDYRAKIDKGFNLVHGLGVVIGKDAIIHENCTVYQGVTIGGTGKMKLDKNGVEKWQPEIFENSIIYTNAMVLGPINISKNSIIKAGERITKDV